MCLCCPRRSAVEIAATVRRSQHVCKGVACLVLLPYTAEDLICLQFLHICIFTIALYKYWNVYFHYIAMQCILFKIIMWRGQKNGSQLLSFIMCQIRRGQIIQHCTSLEADWPDRCCTGTCHQYMCIAASLRFSFLLIHIHVQYALRNICFETRGAKEICFCKYFYIYILNFIFLW